MKVKDLKAGMDDVTIEVEIDYIPKNSWGVAFVKDDTKDIKIIFSSEELKIAKEGMKLKIKKGNVTLNRGQLLLNPNKDYPMEFVQNNFGFKKMENKDLEDRKSELKKKIITLEWDKKRNQINFSKKLILEKYKKELEEINQNH